MKSISLLFVASLLIAGSLSFGDYPEKPIRVIVPTAAGGGHDTMARIFQRTLQEKDLFPQKWVIVNIPGAGGAVGTRKIKDSKNDGYTIGIWNPALVSAKLMGITRYDHSDYEIICMTGYTDLGLGVKEDSSLLSPRTLIEKAKAKPQSIKLATEIGTSAHIIPMIMADEAGFEFRFIPSGGGAKRLASILGGHTDVALFSTLALINFRESGLRPLIVFSDNRSTLLPETPTAKETGIDLSMTESRIWLAPKGTPKDRMELIRQGLRLALEDPATKKRLQDLGINPVYGEGQEAIDSLDKMRSIAEPILKKIKR